MAVKIGSVLSLVDFTHSYMSSRRYKKNWGIMFEFQLLKDRFSNSNFEYITSDLENATDTNGSNAIPS